MTETCPHDWTRTEQPRSEIEEWACRKCELTSATCCVCDRATETALLICRHCITREERILEDIPRILRQPGGQRTTDVTLPGGPAWPKSPMDFRVRVSGGRATTERSDSESVYERLGAWAQMWAARSGTTTSADPIADLKGLIVWAAHNHAASDWLDYRGSIRKTRAAALAVVGLAPERLVDRCSHCGGRVVQDRADARGIAYGDGLQDIVRCTGCGMTWGDRVQFRRNVRQIIHELGDRHADLYVTREHARQIYPDVEAGTLRQWIKRDRDRYIESIRAYDQWCDTSWAWEAGETDVEPGDEPEIWDREIREDEDGRLRLGDLHVLVLRLRGGDTLADRAAG